MIHFPINCVVVDLVSTLGDNLRHNEVQVAMHGPEDVVGFQALLTSGISSRRSVVDHGGQAIRCQAEAARRLLRENEAARGIMMEYAALAQDEVAQLAAGEVQLKVVERVATHLYQLTKTLDERVIPVTHGRIGERLGIRRPSVTESCQTLEKDGLIRQVDKGRIDVVDAAGLARRVSTVWPMLHQARQAFTDRMERDSSKALVG
jgi:CRP-like cAMP-binding protein